jgi:hypothetical protein
MGFSGAGLSAWKLKTLRFAIDSLICAPVEAFPLPRENICLDPTRQRHQHALAGSLFASVGTPLGRCPGTRSRSAMP